MKDNRNTPRSINIYLSQLMCRGFYIKINNTWYDRYPNNNAVAAASARRVRASADASHNNTILLYNILLQVSSGYKMAI